MAVSESRIEELQSTFCPQNDRHHLYWESYFPPHPAGDPETLITYMIRCESCRDRGMMLVHAQKRWRVRGDNGGRLYKTPGEAAAAAQQRGKDSKGE